MEPSPSVCSVSASGAAASSARATEGSSVGNHVAEFLRRECGLCVACASFVCADRRRDSDDDGTSSSVFQFCSVCLGVLSPLHQKDRVLPSVVESILPYCQGGGDNHLTRESPTVNLPWLIAVRAHCAVAAAKDCINARAADDEGTPSVRLRTAEEVYLLIKERLRSSLRVMIADAIASRSAAGGGESGAATDVTILSEKLHDEESGYLGVHVVYLPPKLPSSVTDVVLSNIQVERDDGNFDEQLKLMMPPSFGRYIRKHKQQIQSSHRRILNPRKRFRGNDPTLKQGGDPKLNLELRVRRRLESEKSGKLHEWDMILLWLEKSCVSQWLEHASATRAGGEIGDDYESKRWLCELHQVTMQQQQLKTGSKSSHSQCCSVYAASWRRPFYVQGTYTKSRRDVSQTPFYVTGENATMVRKGVSSVEEEICSPLSIGCGGISNRNNEHVSKDISGRQSAPGKGGAIVYGMCKFHASGREDMDVRMLLPPPTGKSSIKEANTSITGRPFVCEIYDAHRIPSHQDLEKVVAAINCLEKQNAISNKAVGNGVEIGANGWPTSLVEAERHHGINPNGVGVSSPLALVSARRFTNLQSETEEKVKLYGCICWTSAPLRSEEELVRKLGCMARNREGREDCFGTTKCIYPLKIQQFTPLRVLHRRSSDVRTRCILHLSARRIDDHWFRLHMSTSAGTYVKEFVHGDCGRSYPSVSSMLGGRVDITELDCEGIAL